MVYSLYSVYARNEQNSCMCSVYHKLNVLALLSHRKSMMADTEQWKH